MSPKSVFSLSIHLNQLKPSLGFKHLLVTCLLHMTVIRSPQFLVAFDCKPLIPNHVGLPSKDTWISTNCASWLLPEQSEGENKRKWEKLNWFYNLISKVTYHYFCHFLSITHTNPDQYGRRLPKGVNSKRLRWLRAILVSSYNSDIIQ